MWFWVGYLLGRGQAPDQYAMFLFCLAGLTACVLFLSFVITVVVGNRLGYKWARGFYPNVFLPDWRGKE